MLTLMPLLSTLSFSLLISSSSVSAITAKSSAYSSSHGRGTLNSVDMASMTITNNNGLNPEPWCIPCLATNTHPFNGPFPGLTRWAGTRKVKPIWILLKQETVSGSGISWAICKSASRSRQITMPAPHHSVFYRQDALLAAQPTASKHWRHNNLSNPQYRRYNEMQMRWEGYLPEQQHDEAEQKDAYNDGYDDDDDDPQSQADRPLNLNVRNHGRHRLHKQMHIYI